MERKGFFEAFLEGWAESTKRKITPAIKPEKLVRALRRAKPEPPHQKPEPPYQWIKEAKYRGQDTSLEPKQYAGLWRWLKNHMR